MSLGKRIKEARERVKLSQKELGEQCGFEDWQSRISNYERGVREPTLLDIGRIAEKTGADAAYLAFGDAKVDPYELTLLATYRLADESGKSFLMNTCGMIEFKGAKQKKVK